MASLFSRNRLRELAQQINTEEIREHITLLETWHDDYHNGSLKKDKETSREQAYNQSVFIKILGYQEKPAAPYSFEPKSTTDKGQLPDAVISWTDVSKGIKNVSAVVELKGAGTDLDRPQRREGNMSPVQQAFKYKTQYRNCPFVIVSNFYEFRLYQDNQLDYEVWTLDDLVSPDNDFLAFKTFYVLLSSGNFIAETGTSKTERLLSDIRIEQQEIGRKFYKEYREARLQLLRDIYANNTNIRSNFSGAIEKAQKIIDRVVFACFAEDRGLLPDNTMHRVILSSENSSLGLSMWSILKGLFDAIDHGSEKLEIPIGYNGGLFKTDKPLNNLQISDEALRPIVNLSRYDFKEELSVSILGHIFEQSISDLEEIKNKVSQNQGIEEIALSRRKRDGIFYTPDYIVRYIVENSLGRYLRENEERFKNEAGLHGDINDANYAKREKLAYGRYQDFLHTVKVVDPACGSGAFLVHVFDYLLAENKRVGAILGDLFSGENYVRDILQNNIYGVDLNEESVEITKLSLWLKSAEKGKKLTALDNNIKCGNSLIDDEAIAGSKAFDWQRQFPEIFVKGGFDVVVGNPPYVDSETMVKHNPIERNHIAKSYLTAKGNWDLFVVFIQKGMDVLKPGGYASMIIPNKILSAPYANALREYVSDRFTLVALTDVSKEGVFDVDVYPVIVNIGKKAGSKTAKITQGVREVINEHVVDNSKLPSNWALLLSEEQTNHSVDTVKLDTLYDVFAAATVNEAYELKELIDEDPNATQNKIINTGTIDPYITTWGISPINYIKDRYLHPHVELTKLGKEKSWYRRDKIIVAGMAVRIEACYSRGAEFFPAKSTTVICEKEEGSPNLKALLALLNSTYVNQLFHTANNQLSMAGGYMNINKNNLSLLDLPRNFVKREDELAELADVLISKTNDLQSKSAHFQSVVKLEYGLKTWPTKLNYWWQVDFEEFVKILKAKLSLDQKDELLELFKKYQPTCSLLYSEITNANSKVDDIAVELYGITSKLAKAA